VKKGKKLEEGGRISGYRFRRNEGQEAQMEERVRKAMAVMGQVWEIGKRRFGGNWERRLKLFDWLVGSVVGLEQKYGGRRNERK